MSAELETPYGCYDECPHCARLFEPLNAYDGVVDRMACEITGHAMTMRTEHGHRWCARCCFGSEAAMEAEQVSRAESARRRREHGWSMVRGRGSVVQGTI